MHSKVSFYLYLLQYSIVLSNAFISQESISNLLLEVAMKDLKYDHVCGVPYTALPIATILSVLTKKSMLMRRKETKAYGTKKSIEGHYKAGQSCLIVEDVVTSGSSVLETVRDLRKEGLVVTDAVIILDREQGGSKNLEVDDVQVKSLFTMSSLIDILVKNGKITEETVTKVKLYLKETQAPVIGMLIYFVNDIKKFCCLGLLIIFIYINKHFLIPDPILHVK